MIVVNVRMNSVREKVLETVLGMRGSNPPQEGTAQLASWGRHGGGPAWSGSRAMLN